MNTNIKIDNTKDYKNRYKAEQVKVQTQQFVAHKNLYKDRRVYKNLTSQIVQLTKDLMTAHSTADHPEGRVDAVHIVERELAGYPMEIFEREGYRSLLIRNTETPLKHFKVILNAHLDVMPGRIEQFEPYEKDGKLYGRGSYDMKAAAAVMIILFRYLAKHLPYPLALQITTDEEVTGKNGAKYQIEKGVRADFVLTGECGSNLQIVHEAKGIIWFKLHTTGKAAHGAYLWKGDNALWKLHEALHALQTLFPVPEREEWVTTMNLARIETDNERFNHVPDGATAYVDVRFIAEDEKDLVKRIKATLPSGVEMEIITHESPQTIQTDNPYLLSLERAVQETTGKKAQLKFAHGVSDVRHFNTVGCRGVEFGPIGHGQHEDEEWVNIKSLETYFFVLETFLTDSVSL